MSKPLKATFVVELKETTAIPEFAFDEIQGLIEKDLRVKKVTRVPVEAEGS